MIFSLSQERKEIHLPHLSDTDIFCFFYVPASISCPNETWFSSISASLKLKKSVLILEENISVFPHWDPKRRWEAGDNWCWLSPRGLSEISKVYRDCDKSYLFIKQFLKRSK